MRKRRLNLADYPINGEENPYSIWIHPCKIVQIFNAQDYQSTAKEMVMAPVIGLLGVIITIIEKQVMCYL